MEFWCISLMFFYFTQFWLDGRPGNEYLWISHKISGLLTPLTPLGVYPQWLLKMKSETDWSNSSQCAAVPSMAAQIWITHDRGCTVWKKGSDHSMDSCPISLLSRGTLQVRILFVRQWSNPPLEQTNMNNPNAFWNNICLKYWDKYRYFSDSVMPLQQLKGESHRVKL